MKRGERKKKIRRGNKIGKIHRKTGKKTAATAADLPGCRGAPQMFSMPPVFCCIYLFI